MNIQEILKLIHSNWVDRVIDNLGIVSESRVAFQNQLADFYGLLTDAAKTGNPTLLDPIIIKWGKSPTQTDLREGQKYTTVILEHMLTTAYAVGLTLLSDQDSLTLISALLPIYIYSFDKAARLEMESQITYVTNELNKAQAQLERLDQSKSNFIAVAAHELKTPLTLIDGYTAMLKELLKQSKDRGQADMLLDGVKNGTVRLRTIVDDMLDVSRIDNNLLSLSFQPVWLNQLFLLLKSELLPTVTIRKQKLETKPFQGDSIMLFADPERIYQSFRNILTNAIKYTPDGGIITIDGRLLPGFVEVIIHDTGIGISEEDQITIFGKFGQLSTPDLHSSGKTKFKGGGSGLGLPIARGIIEAHEGAIWVESQGYDEINCPGSTFHIMLPVRSEPPDPKLAKLLGIDPSEIKYGKDVEI